MPVSMEISTNGFGEAGSKLDGLSKVISEIKEVISWGAQGVTNLAKKNATTNPKVRSGLLRRSNTWRWIGDLAARVFNPVEYAAYQDEGTRYIKPTWFFTGAANEFKNRILAKAKQVLENAAK